MLETLAPTTILHRRSNKMEPYM